MKLEVRTIWITKYALTKGILKGVGVVSDDSEVVRVDTLSSKKSTSYFHGRGKDWHLSEEGAKSQAERMRQRKILSLQKQLAKLEKIRL